MPIGATCIRATNREVAALEDSRSRAGAEGTAAESGNRRIRMIGVPTDVSWRSPEGTPVGQESDGNERIFEELEGIRTDRALRQDPSQSKT